MLEVLKEIRKEQRDQRTLLLQLADVDLYCRWQGCGTHASRDFSLTIVR